LITYCLAATWARGFCRNDSSVASPIDLIPDFLPVIGYADDAIIVVAFVLRSAVRRTRVTAVRAHWPGIDDGFAALSRLAGLVR
jgi:hypothetical protein